MTMSTTITGGMTMSRWTEIEDQEDRYEERRAELSGRVRRGDRRAKQELDDMNDRINDKYRS